MVWLIVVETGSRWIVVVVQVVVVGVVVVVMASSLAMAKNPNNWETWTLPDDDSNKNVYISCLDRYVDVVWKNITITYRDFVTPSGTYQYVESWEWDSVWTATDGSGDTWIGTSSHSPGTTSIMPEKGEVQFTSHETVTPVGDNDGPRLKYSWIFKFKIWCFYS